MRGFHTVAIAICLAAAAGEALIESDVEKLQLGLQMKCLQAEFYKLAGSSTQLTAAQAGVASADAASFMPISGDKTAAAFTGRKTTTSGSKVRPRGLRNVTTRVLHSRSSAADLRRADSPVQIGSWSRGLCSRAPLILTPLKVPLKVPASVRVAVWTVLCE